MSQYSEDERRIKQVLCDNSAMPCGQPGCIADNDTIVHGLIGLLEQVRKEAACKREHVSECTPGMARR